MSFVYFMLFVAVTVIAIAIGGSSVWVFVDIPSLIMVAAGLLLFVLASGQWAFFKQGMTHYFRFHDHSQVSRQDAIRINRLFRTLGFVSPALGFLGSLLGGVIILSNLSPETVGSGVAISLLTLFYSCMLSVIVFFPISLYYAGITVPRHNEKHNKTDLT